jgi:UDP-N-acetylmuramoylalanine--D-glutamate ligase
MADKIPCKAVFFSRKCKLDTGVYLVGDSICLNLDGKEEEIIKTTELKLLGAHNIENVMAAIAIADAMGVPHNVIHDVVRDFKAVEHRIEYVNTINGVDYYNDSKGTNPDAAIKGIEAMVKPTYLIGGGYDKGVPFDDWIASFNGKVRQLVLIGATAEMIAETAKNQGFNDITFAADLKEAVKICHDLAKDGEAVLLSPACASWDMFDSYEQRGDLFKEYVNGLE